jgi:hypothetical protein
MARETDVVAGQPQPGSPPVDATEAGALAARRRSDSRLWKLLALGGPIGFAGALPYFLPLLAQARERAVALGKPGPALWIGVLAQLVLLTLLTTFAAWAGAKLSRRTGFDAPYLRALSDGRPAPASFLRELPRALVLGALFSAVILGINAFASPHLPEALRSPAPPAMSAVEKLLETLRGASSAFYGGLVEELLLRWAMLSALAALLGKFKLGAGARFWGANVLSAALFGAGHLPAVHMLGVALTGPVIAYVIVANGLAGLVCGWLFARRGLEAAMAAHAFGDLCLHALPLLLPQI